MELKQFEKTIEECRKALEVGMEHRADYQLKAKFESSSLSLDLDLDFDSVLIA